MSIQIIDEKTYNDFSSRADHYTFLGTPQAARKMADRALKTELIGYFENGELKATAPLAYYPSARLFRYVYLPRGPFMDLEDTALFERFIGDLEKYLKHQNVLYLIVNPYVIKAERDKEGDLVENGDNNYPLIKKMQEIGFMEKTYDPAFEVQWMSVLPIENRTMEELLKDMDQQTRWSVRRALKYDLTLENTSNPDDMKEFARVMAHTGERRGFDGYDESFYASMIEAYGDMLDCWLCYLEPEKLIRSQQILYDQNKKDYDQAMARLEEMPGSKKMQKKAKVALEAMELAEKKANQAREYLEKYGDKILIAASMFISLKDEVVYLFSGAYKEFMEFNAPYAIHHAALSKALAEGRKIYNFYGIMPDFHKGEDGYSLYKFKKGFGCTVVELLGNYILPIDRTKFSLYNRLKSVARPMDLSVEQG